MTKLSRDGKSIITFYLDSDGIQQMIASLRNAVYGVSIPAQIELSGGVVGRKWHQSSRVCALLVYCSETEEMLWDGENDVLNLAIDVERAPEILRRLEIALESDVFYPAEFADLQVRGRPQIDSIYVKIMAGPIE